MKKKENSKQEAHEMEINILPLLKELLKKIWLIVLAGLIVGGVVFTGAKVLIKPTYRSVFTAYVNNKQDKQTSDFLTSSDLSAAKQLVLTYQSILTSNTILTAAAKSIGVDMSYERLASKVKTEVKDDTEIITVYVVDTDPEFAYEYAQAIAKTAPAYMAQIVEGSSMKIIDVPEYNEKRYKPSYAKFGMIGFLIGAFLVVLWLTIRFFVDDTVKDERDIESRFEIPILGIIPDITKVSNSRSDYYYYSQESKEKQQELKENIPEGELEDEVEK